MAQFPRVSPENPSRGANIEVHIEVNLEVK
jgi:hypothetical protein